MGMFWEKEKKPEESRFKEVYYTERKTSADGEINEYIIQDQVTGVHYYQTLTYVSSGKTVSTIPLLDRDGKPLVGELESNF